MSEKGVHMGPWNQQTSEAPVEERGSWVSWQAWTVLIARGHEKLDSLLLIICLKSHTVWCTLAMNSKDKLLSQDFKCDHGAWCSLVLLCDPGWPGISLSASTSGVLES